MAEADVEATAGSGGQGSDWPSWDGLSKAVWGRPRLQRVIAAIRLVVIVVVTAGLVGATPLLLLRWGGWPLDGVPGWDHVEALPLTPATHQLVLVLAGTAAWGSWLLFVSGVVGQVMAHARRRAPERDGQPAEGGRPLSRRLVGTAAASVETLRERDGRQRREPARDRPTTDRVLELSPIAAIWALLETDPPPHRPHHPTDTTDSDGRAAADPDRPTNDVAAASSDGHADSDIRGTTDADHPTGGATAADGSRQAEGTSGGNTIPPADHPTRDGDPTGAADARRAGGAPSRDAPSGDAPTASTSTGDATPPADLPQGGDAPTENGPTGDLTVGVTGDGRAAPETPEDAATAAPRTADEEAVEAEPDDEGPPTRVITATVSSAGHLTLSPWRIGVGTRWSGARVTVIQTGLEVKVYDPENRLIRSLVIDPARRYQPSGGTPGPQPR